MEAKVGHVILNSALGKQRIEREIPGAKRRRRLKRRRRRRIIMPPAIYFQGKEEARSVARGQGGNLETSMFGKKSFVHFYAFGGCFSAWRGIKLFS